MGISQITADFAGQVDVNPRLVRIVSTDDSAAITTAGYLSNAQQEGFVFLPTDFFFITYGSDGLTHGLFYPTFSGSTITLHFYGAAGNATYSGSTVEGNFPVWDDVQGEMIDSGISPSDPSKTKAVMADDTVVSGNFPVFTDTDGTIGDSGAKILAGTTSTWGGGSSSHAFAVTGLTSSCHGSCVIRTSGSAVGIVRAVPSTDTLTVTFDSDPGTGTSLDYLYATAALS